MLMKKEDDIRVRINKALYSGPYVDIREAFAAFIDWSIFCEQIGNPVWAQMAEDIADGYYKRTQCLCP